MEIGVSRGGGAFEKDQVASCVRCWDTNSSQLDIGTEVTSGREEG